jgi:hypothetical protein
VGVGTSPYGDPTFIPLSSSETKNIFADEDLMIGDYNMETGANDNTGVNIFSKDGGAKDAEIGKGLQD